MHQKSNQTMDQHPTEFLALSLINPYPNQFATKSASESPPMYYHVALLPIHSKSLKQATSSKGLYS